MRRTRIACFVTGLILPLGTPSAGGMEHMREVALAYAPIVGEPRCLVHGLLRIPPAWVTGDAAALVLTRHEPGKAAHAQPAMARLPAGMAVLDIVAGAGTVCGGRSAREPRDEVLAGLAALHDQGAGALIVLGFEADAGSELSLGTGTALGDGLVTFCRPRAWAAEPYVYPAEADGAATTPGLPILHLRERHAARTAAALDAALRQAREICGGGAAASPAAPDAVVPFAAGPQAGTVLPTRPRAP